MHKCANLGDLVKSFQTSIYLQNRLRYSRERVSQSLPKISQKLENSFKKCYNTRRWEKTRFDGTSESRAQYTAKPIDTADIVAKNPQPIRVQTKFEGISESHDAYRGGTATQETAPPKVAESGRQAERSC